MYDTVPNQKLAPSPTATARQQRSKYCHGGKRKMYKSQYVVSLPYKRGRPPIVPNDVPTYRPIGLFPFLRPIHTIHPSTLKPPRRWIGISLHVPLHTFYTFLYWKTTIIPPLVLVACHSHHHHHHQCPFYDRHHPQNPSRPHHRTNQV
jgi:hypothetical protein